MKKSRLLAVAAGATMIVGLLAAPGAQAADTTVTFTVEAGSVSLAVLSADGNLSDPTNGSTGSTSSGTIASVQVTDTTADLVGWSVTAAMANPFTSTTDLGTTGATHDTIACTNATITSGVATTFTGTILYTPAAAPGALADNGATTVDTDDCAAKTIGTATGAVGANDATFTTSVSIAIPSSALAGTYTGVIVQTAV